MPVRDEDRAALAWAEAVTNTPQINESDDSHTALGRFVLGSVSAAVAARAHCSVEAAP